ncbi:hypothetical protein ABPG74_009837 [Tetrahymena malaccensis]
MENLRSISICIGANIFLGERGISKMFEALKKIQTLQHLKLKINQGNQFGQNNGEMLIQGLNSLQNLRSLNLKLSVFNNIKQYEPDIIGKCFCQLDQLESFSLTLYRYIGDRNIHKEVINSIKKLTKLQDLKIKIKDSFLKIFDIYDLLNFNEVNLPNLQEFSFVVKDNTYKSPKSESLERYLQILNLNQDFAQEKRNERLLVMLGIFKQVNLFKSVKRLSLSFDKFIPLHFIQQIFDLLKDVQGLIFPQLKMSIDSFESPEEITGFTNQLIKFQGIQELTLQLQEEISIIHFFQLIKGVTQLKNLQKFSFTALYISEITYMSDSDEVDSEYEYEEEDNKNEKEKEVEKQQQEKIDQINQNKNDECDKYEEFKEKEEANNTKQKIHQEIFQEMYEEEVKELEVKKQEHEKTDQINQNKNDEDAKCEEFKEKEEVDNTKQKIDKEIFQEIEDQANFKSMKEEQQEREQKLKNELESGKIKQEQKQQNLIESFVNQDVINYYSNLKETNFKIKSYQFDGSYKQVNLNQFLSQLRSVSNLKISYYYDDYNNGENSIQKLQIDQLICSNLKVLRINFYHFEQEVNLIQLFNIIKTLSKLEKLGIILKSQQKMNLDQTLAFQQSLKNLQNLKQLTVSSNFQQSEDLLQIKTFFEGICYLNLEKLTLQIPESTLDSRSAQYFSEQVGKLKIDKIFNLQIKKNNQFFINGADVFLQSLINIQQIVIFELNLQKQNIQKEQFRNIFSQLRHLSQLQKLKITFTDVAITKDDIQFIRESIKQLQQLQELSLMLDSFLVLYLMNLHQDLPFLYLVSSEYFDIKLKRNGLNRFKFCKLEAEKSLNNISPLQQNNTNLIQKNFELLRVKIDFKNLILKNEIESKWAFQNLIIPQNIELKLPSMSQVYQQNIVSLFKNFELHQKIRYVKLNFPQKLNKKPCMMKIDNIFYKIKYLVEFKLALF